MLTEEQWAAVRRAVYEVCNRGSDVEYFPERGPSVGEVRRYEDHAHGRMGNRLNIIIYHRGGWDLEPDPEDRLP